MTPLELAIEAMTQAKAEIDYLPTGTDDRLDDAQLEAMDNVDAVFYRGSKASIILRRGIEALKALPTPSQRAGRPKRPQDRDVSGHSDFLKYANDLERYCDTLESQRAGSDTEGAWRPIETAPKDGSCFIAEVCGGFCYIFFWHEPVRAFVSTGSLREDLGPIRWIPIPPTTPATSDEGEKPPQRSLEGGKTSESLPPPHHPQGQRAEQTCEGCGGDGVISCPEEKGSGYAKTSDLCPTCHGSGKRPTSNEGE